MNTESLYDESDPRILVMGCIAASRVNAQTLAVLRHDIERQRQFVGDQPYYRECLERIDDGPGVVAALLADESQHGRYMRAVAPLRAFVPRQECDNIF